ncbi:MAG: aroF [Chloroflexi bacterium]|nr:aroF [Chloroflexota bacterium]
MVIVMQASATPEQMRQVLHLVETSGFHAHINDGVERKVVAVLGEVDIDKVELVDRFENLPGVEKVNLISAPFKLSSRQYHPEDYIVRDGNLAIGGNRVCIAAGPCSVESPEQIMESAIAVRAAGASMLRGGAFKPRSSPHSFQGLGEPGLKMLAEAGEETGLPVITEVMDAHDLDLVCRYAQFLQIGARNMQNFTLLRAVGQCGYPVLLKRGPGCRIKDLLMAAEYVLCEGNSRVVLCERGITTFEDAARNTTDINAIPILKELSHLPVFLDPSHSTGEWRWVTPIARAGIAAGADGLIIEVHPNPQAARSDGRQSLKPERFAEMMRQVRAIAEAVGRTV